MTADVLGSLVQTLAKLLDPIARAAASPIARGRLLDILGVVAGAEEDVALLSALDHIAALRADIETIAADPDFSFETVRAALDALQRAFALSAEFPGSGSALAPLDELGSDLANLLLTGFLSRSQGVRAVLALLTLLDPFETTGAPIAVGNVVRVPFQADRLRPGRVLDLLEDPVAALRGEYVNNLQTDDDAAAMADKLFPRLGMLLEALGVTHAYGIVPGEEGQLGDAAPLMAKALILYFDDPLHGPGEAGIVLSFSPASRGDLGLVVSPFGNIAFTRQIGGWEIESKTTAEIDVVAWGRHGLTLPAGPAAAGIETSLTASLDPAEAGEPAARIGPSDGSRLEIGRARLAMAARLADAKPSLTLSADVVEAELVIAAPSDDGFLSALLGNGAHAKFDVGLVWSSASGLSLRGSGGLEADIQIGRSIGGATLQSIHLGLRPGNGALVAEVAATFSAGFGPVRATVEQLGLNAALTFPPSGGNLHVVNVEMGLKPPSGIGIAIDGGGFSGGGFLNLDPAKGEYFGMLELSFQGVVDVRAAAILNTRLPNGQKGFSLLILISAEFTPIQLSFGFTLLGVGGLIGLNRTIMLEVLRTGIRDGSLNSVLFPRDVVVNAPRIIGDLKRIFPPFDGHFLIGPMAKLGWGTPTIVSLELGLLLELPRPAFAVVGVLRVTLPTPEAAIIRIQVNFLGVVDFERKQFSFDAALYDSYVLFMTLTGDMAVRVFWGDDANFLLSVGGFHPSYRPPPAMNLGHLQRLALVISQPMPLIRAEVYFAVTTNTVQFGAKVELKAGPGVFNIYGFLSLDALIQFDPFQFVVEIAGMLAVRSGSSVLFAVRLEMTLSGPSPWRARGKASFEIGFIFTITISIGFDITVGDEVRARLATIRILDLLLPALNADAAWRAIPAGGHSSQVTLRALPPGGPLVLNPAGALAVRQSAVPLNLPLSRVGARPIEGGNIFRIANVRVGGTEVPVSPLREQFAPAQFTEMSDAQKLSRASFERLEAGVEARGGDAPKSDFMRVVELAFEVIYVRKPRPGIRFRLHKALADFLVMGSAAAASAIGSSRFRPSVAATPPVRLDTEGFAVARVSDMRVHGEGLVFVSQAEAAAAQARLVAHDPTLAHRLQVLPRFELAA